MMNKVIYLIKQLIILVQNPDEISYRIPSYERLFKVPNYNVLKAKIY